MDFLIPSMNFRGSFANLFHSKRELDESSKERQSSATRHRAGNLGGPNIDNDISTLKT